MERLEEYAASSYPCYIGKRKAPAWLTTEPAHAALGRRDQFRGYRAFVELGIENEVREYYAKERQSPILGGDDFRAHVLARANAVTTETARFETRPHCSPDAVLAAVAAVFAVDPAALRARDRSRCPDVRACARWLCQQLTGLTQPELGAGFGGVHYSTVSQAARRFRLRCEQDNELRQLYDIVKSRFDP